MKIGEISKVFDLSAEMLRYIEREGLVHPVRHENGYREYDLRTFGELFEYMKNRSIGLPVRDIKRLTQAENLADLPEELRRRREELQEQIRRETLLAQYLQEYSERIALFSRNVGLHWLAKRPAFSYIRVGTQSASLSTESYCHSELATQWRRQAPFVSVDSVAQAPRGDEIRIQCFFCIDRRYERQLDILRNEDVTDVEEQLCLHTFVKLRENEDIRHCFGAILDKAAGMGYKAGGLLRSQVLLYSWGESEGKSESIRCLHLTVPVEG